MRHSGTSDAAQVSWSASVADADHRVRHGVVSSPLPGSHRSRITAVTDFFYLRMRHRDAWSSAAAEAIAPEHGFESLRGHKYCLLTTFRKSGKPVPTPVWFGLADGKASSLGGSGREGEANRKQPPGARRALHGARQAARFAGGGPRARPDAERIGACRARNRR